MSLAVDIIVHLVAIPVIFLASTIAFDVVHRLLHLAHGSRFALLDWAGGLHATHHDFLDTELRVHDELIGANIRRHVIPEFVTQAAFGAIVLVLLYYVPILPWTAVVGAFAIQVAVFALIMRERGLDINHRGHEKLDAFRDTFFCMPEYHALHHVHPDAHFSSWIKALDYALGSGLWLEGRRIAWIGDASDAVAALRTRLEAAGVEEVGLDAASAERAEILVVSGDLEAEPIASTVARFIERADASRFPSEIWWVREPGEAHRLPELTKRIQLRRLAAKPGADTDGQARRWMAGLRRGQCRI